MKINEELLLDVDDLKNPEGNFDIDGILEYEEILLAISDTLTDYRNKYNLTQSELAKKIGIKQEMVSKLESGYYNPTMKLLHKISRKLTNSSNMLIQFLENVIVNIKKMEIINYEVGFTKEKYIYGELNESKGNIIYMDFNRECNNKEEKYYGGEYCTSSVSNGGQFNKGLFTNMQTKAI